MGKKHPPRTRGGLDGPLVLSMLEVESMLILSIFREVLCGALVGACLGFGYFRLLRKWGEGNKNPVEVEGGCGGGKMD